MKVIYNKATKIDRDDSRDRHSTETVILNCPLPYPFSPVLTNFFFLRSKIFFMNIINVVKSTRSSLSL